MNYQYVILDEVNKHSGIKKGGNGLLLMKMGVQSSFRRAMSSNLSKLSRLVTAAAT